MADNPNKRGTPDNDLVSLSQPWEVNYWTKRFNKTEAQLREAIRKVGNGVKALERHFGK